MTCCGVSMMALWSNQCITDINLEILDPPRHVSPALTRDISQAAERARLSQIQDQPMRMIRLGIAPLRVPEIRGLAVDGVLRRAVFASALFGIDVRDRPAFVAQRLAGFVEQIELRNRGEGFAVVGVERFDAEIAPAGAGIEVNVLDLSAGFELACFYGLHCVQREFHLWP